MKSKFSWALTSLLFVSQLAGQEVPDVTPQYEFMVARLAAEEGDLATALEHMDRVVAKNPDNPVVLYERASMLADGGRMDRARTELQQITKRFPDFYDAHRLLGRLLLEQRGGRETLDAALTELREATRLNPDDVASGLTVAQLLLASNRLPEAEKVLGSLAERLPDNKVVNFNYAQVLTRLGRGDESRQFFERAVATDPTYAPAVLQLVDIYQKGSDWQKAASVLEPLSSQDPTNLDLQRQQGYFYLRAGANEKARAIFEGLSKADPKDDRNQFFLAEALNDLERYGEAEKIYARLLKATPNDPELLVSAGLNLMSQRRYDDAARTFLTLINVDNLPAGVVQMGKTQLALIDLYRGDYESALTKARELIKGPKGLNTQAVSLTTEVYRRQKKYEEGLEFLRPLMKEAPTEPAVVGRYLEFLFRAGKTQEAKALAEAQRKNGVRGAMLVAEVYTTVQKYDEAIAVLTQLVKENPEEKSLQFQLASAEERSGDMAAAEKIFLALLEREPDDPATLNYLGYMWADKGVNLDRAEQMLLKAVAQDPRNGAFIDSLGWVYFKQGKFDSAEKQLIDAAQLLPYDATVQEHLGDVLAKLGKRAQALERYRAALRLDPTPADEAQLRTKIANFEGKSSVAKP
jgi:predicted Zn-dependent protease